MVGWIELFMTQMLLLLLLLLHLLIGLFSRTTLVSQYQKGKISLGLNEARDYEVLGSNDTNWTIGKQSAPPDHTKTSSLNFYRPDVLPNTQPTMSKH